jgi:hypothetical protein
MHVDLSVQHADIHTIDGCHSRVMHFRCHGAVQPRARRGADRHRARRRRSGAQQEPAGAAAGTGIEHCGCPSDDKIATMARVGVVPGPEPMQVHLYADSLVEEYGEYGGLFYPYGSVERQGVPVVVSSNAPVTMPGPLRAAWAAVTRATTGGNHADATQGASHDAAFAASPGPRPACPTAATLAASPSAAAPTSFCSTPTPSPPRSTRSPPPRSPRPWSAASRYGPRKEPHDHHRRPRHRPRPH